MDRQLPEALRGVTADLGRSLPGFAPEIVLVVTIVLLLVVPLFFRRRVLHLGGLALVGCMAALLLSMVQLMNLSAPGMVGGGVSGLSMRTLGHLVRTQPDQAQDGPIDLFTGGGGAGDQDRAGPAAGLLRFDAFTVFFRIFLLCFAALIIWLTGMTGIPDRQDSPDFYTLLIGATLGMCLMVSAVHLLMIFIAIEMASLPSYALAGFLKGRRDSSEASLKYVVFGAGASGIMLYGMSLLAGKYGTAHVPSLAMAVAHSGRMDTVLVVGLLLMLVGIAFKLSAVPFHFWCPDVFEGAAAEVAGFLSVASKGAALGLLARLSMSLSCNATVASVAGRPPVALFLGATVALLAAVTATYGNLAAYAQTNLKRLLAFSTIAHAGYMMMPLAAALSMGRQAPLKAQQALESLVFYLVIYLFMNLGAFAVVALIRNMIGSEDLRDYAGFIRRSPLLTVAMAVFLLSLTGVPPLAGFAAKFRIFYVLYEAKLIWLLAVGLANSVFSLFYYVKVIRVMIIDPCPAEVAPGGAVPSGAGTYCGLLIAANLAVILVWGAWDALAGLTQFAVPHLLGVL